MDDIEINVTTPAVNFWNALEIYYKHPNSINKQVLLKEDIFSANLQSSINHSECRLLYEKFLSKLTAGCSLDDDADYTSINPNFEIIKSECINELFTYKTGMYLLIRRLVPKFYKPDNIKFYEFIFLDKNNMKVYVFTANTVHANFINVTGSDMQDPFVILKFDFIQLSWNINGIKLGYNKSLNEKGYNWIKVTFATKFTKLLISNINGAKICKNVDKFEFKSQVDVVEYYKLYEKLKQKYAKTVIENWTETTDPKKFVYEDIGIAAYLILLWGREKTSGKGTKKQKFFDLGCGNGLLVHILNSEGHCGIGLDIRRRKIWDVYPSTTVLKEKTIIPTDTNFPEADWLIGNHSDELTAWLPVMARRSNNFCQYFVLPCCPYQLNGKKFQRKNSGLSSYQNFIHYVRDISDICQFETQIDKLRIPSTKRICLLGFNYNVMSEEEFTVINKKIANLVAEECQGCKSGDKEKNTHALNFTPREAIEPVRNCTKVAYTVRENILKTVMNELLKEKVFYSVTKDGETYFWNRGGKIPVHSLAACIDQNLLKELKNECKGLQTLLKNHHFLFEISHGCVQFRTPESMLKICKNVLDSQKELKWKRKSCWLFSNHPDGCALSDDMCSYTHVK